MGESWKHALVDKPNNQEGPATRHMLDSEKAKAGRGGTAELRSKSMDKSRGLRTEKESLNLEMVGLSAPA